MLVVGVAAAAVEVKDQRVLSVGIVVVRYLEERSVIVKR